MLKVEELSKCEAKEVFYISNKIEIIKIFTFISNIIEKYI